MNSWQVKERQFSNRELERIPSKRVKKEKERFNMGNFLAAAGKKTTDIKTFLRAAQSGNGIRYRAESGKKHFMYIPYITGSVADEEGNAVEVNEIVALYGNVHDWTDNEDKYHAHVCLEGTVLEGENGEIINDGTCPICDRIKAAWEIYNYRYALEERTCGKTGTELAKHMEKIKGTLANERKSKEAKAYLYMLVALFKTNADNTPVIGQDGMPEYDLKIMKLSSSRVEKIQTQLENAGVEMTGCELIMDYPKNDDVRQVVGQSTTSPVFPNNKLTNKFPGLEDKIKADVDKFVESNWEGLAKAYPEWDDMSTKQAKMAMDKLYEKWDEYQTELETNKEAKYLEYDSSNDTQPSLGAQPSLGGAPQIGAQQMSGGVQMPNGGTQTTAENGMPKLGGLPDVNDMFNGEDVHL